MVVLVRAVHNDGLNGGREWHDGNGPRAGALGHSTHAAWSTDVAVTHDDARSVYSIATQPWVRG